jgi:hypothetical protein
MIRGWPNVSLNNEHRGLAGLLNGCVHDGSLVEVGRWTDSLAAGLRPHSPTRRTRPFRARGFSGSPKGPAAAHFWIGQDREADPGVYRLQTVVVMEDVDYRRVHLQYQ